MNEPGSGTTREEEGIAALHECLAQRRVPGELPIYFKPNNKFSTPRQIAPRNEYLGGCCDIVTAQSDLFLDEIPSASEVIQFRCDAATSAVQTVRTWQTEQLQTEEMTKAQRKSSAVTRRFTRLDNHEAPAGRNLYCIMVVDADSILFTRWLVIVSRNDYWKKLGKLLREPEPVDADSRGPVPSSVRCFQPDVRVRES
jgi:hypothetical protein